MLNHILEAVFLAVGGFALVSSLVLKYVPEWTERGLLFLFEKFPKFRQLVHDNLQKLKEFEDAELEAIKKAEDQA